MLLVPHLLKILNVKHTVWFLNQRLAVSPLGSLGQWSAFLDTYQVASVAVRLQPQQLAQATFPCVAHCQNAEGQAYFVVVEGVSEGQVTYYDGTKSHSVGIEAFAQLWSGSVLLLATDERSGESNY